MTETLKVGDRVRVKDGYTCSECKGRILIIRQISPASVYPFACSGMRSCITEIFKEEALLKERTLGEDIVPSGVYVRDCQGMLTIEKVKEFLNDILGWNPGIDTVGKLKDLIRNKAGFELIGYY